MIARKRPQIMNQAFRHMQILEMINRLNYVSIEELVETFGVTPQTIRRDLNSLAKNNEISRHHGGACVESSTQNTSYSVRKDFNRSAKNQIGSKLAELIPDNSSIFLNIGTTTEAIARALLNHKNLTVVTNNIHIASTLSENPDCSIIIAGGEVRNGDGGIIGEATSDFINQFKLDFGIIGISGISDDGSLMDYDLREARVSQAIINNSRNVILAADQSKFGRTAMIRVAHIEQANHLFTDFEPSPKIKDLLDAREIVLHNVSAE